MGQYDEAARVLSSLTREVLEEGHHSNEGGAGNPIPEAVIEGVAAKAAISAASLVGTKIAEEMAKREEEAHQSPISPHCERVLETPPKCWDFRGTRSYCMCYAWKLMEDQHLTRLPVGRAWMKVREVCTL